jgi:tetratricopeptide (TPR) repeat protein
MLAWGVLLTGAVTAASVRAQSDADLEALNQRVIELYGAGRYSEAIPLAERYAEAMKVWQGSDRPEYATALINLALLLKETNRLGEVEPLYRRALAIYEKSLGPEHPNVATALNNLAFIVPCWPTSRRQKRPVEAQGRAFSSQRASSGDVLYKATVRRSLPLGWGRGGPA